MPFKKGHKLATGRKAGSKNRFTKDLRDSINEFLNKHWPLLEKDFDKLDPEKRFLMFEKLLKYSLPALQSTTIETDFSKMTESQLDYIIETLKKSLADE